MNDRWSPRFTFVLALWGAALTTFVTVIVFVQPPDIPMGTATAYATFISGPLTAAFFMYRWSRTRPEERKNDDPGAQ